MEWFGPTIKEYRENLGLSQKQVAEKLGMNQSNYSKIERGIQEPNLNQLKALAETLHLSIDEVLGVSKNKNKSNEYENILIDIQKIIKKYTK